MEKRELLQKLKGQPMILYINGVNSSNESIFTNMSCIKQSYENALVFKNETFSSTMVKEIGELFGKALNNAKEEICRDFPKLSFFIIVLIAIVSLLWEFLGKVAFLLFCSLYNFIRSNLTQEAKKLATKLLDKHKKKTDFIVLCHSHGGMVAKELLEMDYPKTWNFIVLGCPELVTKADIQFDNENDFISLLFSKMDFNPPSAIQEGQQQLIKFTSIVQSNASSDYNPHSFDIYFQKLMELVDEQK